MVTVTQPSTPPPSWWAQPNLTWQQWSDLAAQRALQMRAVTTNQHVQKPRDE